MQKKSAKPYILFGIVDVLLLFAVLFVWTALNFNGSHNNYGTQCVSITGEYSANGESWIQMQSSDDFENKNYEKVVFRGRLSQNIPKNQWLIISMCDAWIELKVNGKTVASNLDGPGASTDTPGN